LYLLLLLLPGHRKVLYGILATRLNKLGAVLGEEALVEEKQTACVTEINRKIQSLSLFAILILQVLSGLILL
jgi:hypothetical protein